MVNAVDQRRKRARLSGIRQHEFRARQFLAPPIAGIVSGDGRHCAPSAQKRPRDLGPDEARAAQYEDMLGGERRGALDRMTLVPSREPCLSNT